MKTGSIKPLFPTRLTRSKKCVTDEWVLVDSQGGIIPGEKFFYVVEQGMLLHTTMTKEILRVKVYGDIA